MMNKAEDSRSPGQVLYEVLASDDRTSRHWPEWRELSSEDQAVYEKAVTTLLQQLRDNQDC